MTENADHMEHDPFYHGTRADLKTGDLLSVGHPSNFRDQPLSWIYFSQTLEAAIWGAELATGDGRQRIYIVKPTGSFMDDPNLTDKKFPGNPTRSYRSSAPLKIVGEVTDWVRLTPEELKRWREKLVKIEPSKGKIIN